MDLPVWPHVPEKSSLLLTRKRTPDFLGKRTQRVDHGAPVAAHALCGVDLHADQPQKPTNGGRRGFIPEWRPRCRRLMTLRQQSAAGKNMNRPIESALPQGYGDIHTGQPRTDEQNALLLHYVSSRGGRPRIGNVTLAVRRFSRQMRIARRKIAQRENDLARAYASTAAQTNSCNVAHAIQSDSFVLYVRESTGMTFNFLLQNRTDVLTE